MLHFQLCSALQTRKNVSAINPVTTKIIRTISKLQPFETEMAIMQLIFNNLVFSYLLMTLLMMIVLWSYCLVAFCIFTWVYFTINFMYCLFIHIVKCIVHMQHV